MECLSLQYFYQKPLGVIILKITWPSRPTASEPKDITTAFHPSFFAEFISFFNISYVAKHKTHLEYQDVCDEEAVVYVSKELYADK